jgi:hypothetical protein
MILGHRHRHGKAAPPQRRPNRDEWVEIAE